MKITPEQRAKIAAYKAQLPGYTRLMQIQAEIAALKEERDNLIAKHSIFVSRQKPKR